MKRWLSVKQYNITIHHMPLNYVTQLEFVSYFLSIAITQEPAIHNI